MTEKLREALRESAERGRPVDVPDTLWRDARQARRRELLAVPALALLLVAGVGLGIGLMRSTETDPPPASGDGDALPSELHSIPTWIGVPESDFPGETDLKLGRVSVAFVSDSGRPVLVTADDGAYHVMRLPGFEESRIGMWDDAATMTISPDGRRLAWSWHGALPDRNATPYPVASGLRVADLETGEVRTYPMTEGMGVKLGGLNWAPNGRYLAYSLAVMRQWDEGGEGSNSFRAERLDTGTGERLRLGRPFGQVFDSTLAVSTGGSVAQASNERELLTWIVARDPRGSKVELESDGSVGSASTLWSADARSVLIAPLSGLDPGPLARVDLANLDNEGRVRATLLRSVDHPVRLLGAVDDEWVLAFDGPFEGQPWDGRLRLYPVSGVLDREPVLVTELVIKTDEGEVGQLTAAWKLVDTDDPSRDFPEPDWPMDPDTRLMLILLSVGGALIGVLGLAWLVRRRHLLGR